jgi:RimJ/RimL family protein N-acetyltransferase
VNPSWLMPFRRCIARVSSNVFTARSMETSPQISSLTLLLEPPKSSPTVPLNDAPDLLLSAILTNVYTSERMPRTGDGCNILYLERGDTIRIEEAQTLQGESVTLRPPRETDVDVVYSWDRDPELAAWNGRSPISISLSAARRDYLARWEDPSVKTFIIEARGEPIGMATLYDFRRDGCELGIKIGPGNLRGRGYATEAVTLLIDYVFDTLGLSTVRGSTLAHNDRMQRVFEKNGFVQTGDGSLLSRYDNRRYTELFYERRRDDH